MTIRWTTRFGQRQLHMAEEEEPPAVEPGPTLLTTELVAANLSILEEVQLALTDGTWVENETGSAPDTGHPDGCGFAYTKCELGTSQCEVEAATDRAGEAALRHIYLI